MCRSDGAAIGVSGAHREINHQHQRLAALVRRIQRLIRQQRPNDSVSRLLKRLIAAAEAHFDYEAYVQNSLGLKGQEYHDGSRIRPEALIKLREHYDADRPPHPTEAIDILNTWLKRHQDDSIEKEITLHPDYVQENAAAKAG